MTCEVDACPCSRIAFLYTKLGFGSLIRKTRAFVEQAACSKSGQFDHPALDQGYAAVHPAGNVEIMGRDEGCKM